MTNNKASACPHPTQELDRRLGRMAAADVSLILWSFSQLALFPPQALMQRVCAAMAPELGGLPPQELANTLQVGCVCKPCV